jgi:hypothetical protein
MKVTMFKERFAEDVCIGNKLQTVRPMPRRRQDLPKVGERRSLRRWTGRPYNSPQEELRQIVVAEMGEITIGDIYVILPDWVKSLKAFALADGFLSVEEFMQFFRETHGLPFHGYVMRWEK